MAAVLRLNTKLPHSCHLPEPSSSGTPTGYVFVRLRKTSSSGTPTGYGMVRLRKTLKHVAEKPYASLTQNGRLPSYLLVPRHTYVSSRTEHQPTYSYLHTFLSHLHGCRPYIAPKKMAAVRYHVIPPYIGITLFYTYGGRDKTHSCTTHKSL